MARKKVTTQKENCQNQFKQSMQHKTTAGHLKFPQMRGGGNKKNKCPDTHNIHNCKQKQPERDKI